MSIYIIGCHKLHKSRVKYEYYAIIIEKRLFYVYFRVKIVLYSAFVYQTGYLLKYHINKVQAV